MDHYKKSGKQIRGKAWKISVKKNEKNSMRNIRNTSEIPEIPQKSQKTFLKKLKKFQAKFRRAQGHFRNNTGKNLLRKVYGETSRKP